MPRSTRHRLEETGLLVSAREVVAGRRRRSYRLTAAGAAALAEQGREFSGSVARVLGILSAAAPRRPVQHGVTA